MSTWIGITLSPHQSVFYLSLINVFLLSVLLICLSFPSSLPISTFSCFLSSTLLLTYHLISCTTLPPILACLCSHGAGVIWRIRPVAGLLLCQFNRQGSGLELSPNPVLHACLPGHRISIIPSVRSFIWLIHFIFDICHLILYVFSVNMFDSCAPSSVPCLVQCLFCEWFSVFMLLSDLHAHKKMQEEDNTFWYVH